MITIESLLGRADDEILQELVGAPVVRLLTKFDSTLARPGRLRELVVSLRPPEELLRDQHARARLLSLLPADSARELAAALDLDPDTPYASLQSAQLRKGTRAEARLFAALGVVPSGGEQTPEPSAAGEAEPGYGLFAHQRRVLRAASLFLESQSRRVLLHMPTGSGKTRTAMHMVARELSSAEPAVVVWLAYSEELCEQAATEFTTAWSHLGDRQVELYRLWGSRDVEPREIRDGVVIAGLGKLYSSAKRSLELLMALSDRSSLVVIDEAHQAVAESYRFVLDYLVERIPGRKLLGLTATPGRTWNDPDKDLELSEFFDRQKVSLQVDGYDSPIDYLVESGYIARPEFRHLRYASGADLPPHVIADIAESLDIPDSVLRALASDEQRNLLILTALEDLARRHRRTIVFAATVEHARLLASVLRARSISADVITGTSPSGERARVVARFKDSSSEHRVLCNYGVLTAGFDAPATSAALIARPTKSLVLYSQMVGRATRGTRAGGNATAEVVTVVDTGLPGFGEMTEAFTNWEDVWR